MTTAFYGQKIFGEKFSYEDMELKNGTIILYHANLGDLDRLEEYGGYHYQAEKIEIDYQLDLFNFSLFLDLHLTNPKITIAKVSPEPPPLKMNLKPNAWGLKINYVVQIDGGVLELADYSNNREEYQVLHFDIQGEHQDKGSFQLALMFGEEVKLTNRLNLNLNYDNQSAVVTSQVDQVTIDEIFQTLGFWIDQANQVRKTWNVQTGLVEGSFNLILSKDKEPLTLGEISFKDLNVCHQSLPLKFSLPEAHLSLWEGVRFEQEGTPVLMGNSLVSSILEKNTGHLILKKGAVLQYEKTQGKGWLFKDLVGMVSFKADALSEIQLNGVFDSLGTEEDVEIEGFGRFLTQTNIPDGDLSLKIKHPQSFDARMRWTSNQITSHKQSIHCQLGNFSEIEANLLKDIFSFYYPSVSQFDILEGSFTSNMRLTIDDLHLTDCWLDNFTVKNLQFQDNAKDIYGGCSEISGNFSIQFNQNSPLQTVESQLIVSNGELYQKLSDEREIWLEDFQMQAFIKQGRLQQSLIQGKTCGMDTTFEWNRLSSENICKLFARGKLEHLATMLPKNYQGILEAYQNNPIQISLKGYPKDVGLKLNGSLKIDKDPHPSQDIYFGFDIDLLSNWLHASQQQAANILDEMRLWVDPFSTKAGKQIRKTFPLTSLYRLSKGWFIANKVNLDDFSSFLFSDQQQVNLSGIMNIRGRFNEEAIILHYQGQDICLDKPNLKIEIHEFDQTETNSEYPGLHFFDLRTKNHFGSFSVKKGTCVLKEHGATFEDITGNVSVSNSHLFSSNIQTHSEGVNIATQLDLDWVPGKLFDLFLQVNQIEASALDMRTFISLFNSNLNLFPIEANLFIPEGGGILRWVRRPDWKDFELKVKGEAKHGHYNLDQMPIAFKEGQFSFEYDYNDGTLLLEDIEGYMALQADTEEKTYRVKSDPIRWSPSGNASLPFDIKASDKTKDILHLVGLLDISESGRIDLQLNTKLSHIGKMTFKEAQAIFDDKSIQKLSIKSETDYLAWRDFIDKGLAAYNFKIPGFLQEAHPFLPETVLFGSLIYNPANEKIELLLEELNSPQEESSFKFQGSYQDHRLEVSQLTYRDWNLYATGFTSANQLEIESQFKHISQDFQGSFSGVYDFTSAKFCGNNLYIQGNLEKIAQAYPSINDKGAFKGKIYTSGSFEINFSNYELAADLMLSTHDLAFNEYILVDQDKKSIKLLVNPQNIEIEGIKLFITQNENHLGSFWLQPEKISYNFSERQLSLYQAQFALNPSIFQLPSLRISLGKHLQYLDKLYALSQNNQVLEGQIDLKYSTSYWDICLKLKEGAYQIKEKSHYVKDFSLYADPFKWKAVLEYQLQEQSIWIVGKKEDPNKNMGSLVIYDRIPDSYPTDKLPLSIYWAWDEGLIIQRVGGSFANISAQFARHSSVDSPTNVLLGKVVLHGSEYAKYLPLSLQQLIKKIRLGKGYEISGELSLSKHDLKEFQFEGFLGGKKFECFDYSLQTLKGKVSIHPTQIMISNLKISDPAGELYAKEMLFHQHLGTWSLSIPWVNIQNFSPCLLNRLKADNILKGKPVIIDNLIIKGIKGHLNHPNSFKGVGKIDFHKSQRKTASILEIPAHIISRIGLDMNMLVPEQGSITYEIKEGKIVLNKFIDVYSHDKHCRFYLAKTSTPSYIDFQGNLDIKIKMKQYVLLKFTEPFIISIHGNFKKPNYQFQKKKSKIPKHMF